MAVNVPVRSLALAGCKATRKRLEIDFVVIWCAVPAVNRIDA